MALRAELFICFTLIAVTAHAGDGAAKSAPRKEFHQRSEYPYVFEPVPYLAARGPAPLRFGPPAVDCSHRDAPALPDRAKGSAAAHEQTTAADAEKVADPESRPAAIPEQTTVAPTPAPAFPVPQNGPADPDGHADFNKAPDEVVGYFRDPYNFVPNSHRFFDPIFEPAKIQTGPQSKATYQVKP